MPLLKSKHVGREVKVRGQQKERLEQKQKEKGGHAASLYDESRQQQIKQQQDKGTDSSSIQPPHARRSREEILKQHSAYDTYVAARDPAHPMFASLFGHKFANDYLYQVLFPLAERNKEEGNDDSAIVP